MGDLETKLCKTGTTLGKGGVIPGWEEGVASMRPGGRRLVAGS